jgi:hypothetical protein
MNSRQKGARGERRWRDELRAHGFDARRRQQFSGSPDSPDVVCDELDWLHFEVTLKDVAGDYYFGDGLGRNCTLVKSSKRKFGYELHGCLGLYNSNAGDFSLENGILKLTLTKLNDRPVFPSPPTDYFVVRWGSRMYLVPTNDIAVFCSTVNQGRKPRHEDHCRYYLRNND